MEPEPDIKVILNATLDALTRLLNLFRFERIIHVVIGIVAFLMLLYAITLLFRSNGVDTTLLVTLFGSTGLITVSSARITYFFNKAFNLIEDIIRIMTGAKPMSEDRAEAFIELKQPLKSVQQLRYSALTSVILMSIGVVVIIGSFVYSINRLGPLKRQIAQKQDELNKLEEQKQDEIKKLEERIKELRKLLPNDFTGKFGILLETDKEKDGGLESAKTNVYEKGKDRGFDPVYIFSDADGYKTVAVFDNRESAKEKLSLAKKVNTTAEIKDFSVFCVTPKWVDDGGYFDCSKK